MDPTTRLRLLSQMENLSGGKLELFFASYGLGDAYAAPSKGWGKAKRIGAAIALADSRGDGDAILSAAAEHFGLLTDESDGSDAKTDEDVQIWDGLAGMADESPLETRESPEDELCRLAFEAWDSAGEWPIARILQRRIEREGSRSDVELTGRGLEPSIGYLEQKHDGRVVLNVGGLNRTTGAERYVSAFVAAVQLAYRLYVEAETDESPVLSDEVLRKELSLDPDMGWRLYSLLDGESFLLEGGGSNPDERRFRRDISPSIRHFRGVKTIDDYLRARDDLLRPYAAARTSQVRADVRSIFAGRASTVAERGSQVFHTVIFGGTAAIGPNASVQVNVTPGDLSSLMGFLAQHGVDEADRQALTEALASDENAGGDERPGERVRDWLGRASIKIAASGARVGEQTGAALLAAAIAKYLGLI
jgi:hypothetical protein